MTRAQVLALLLTLAIAAAVALSSPSGVFPGSLGTVTTDTYMQPLNDVKDLDVTLRMGAGTLRVTTADSPNAFEATIVHHTGVRVAVDYSGDRLRISDRGPRFVGTTVTNDWTIQLTRRVPMHLVVSIGAGREVLDLTGLTGSVELGAGAGEVSAQFQEGSGTLERITLRGGAGRVDAIGLANAHARRIEVRGGVGELSLDFSGSGNQTTDVDVRGGVGRVVLVLPSGVGARIHARRGLGQVTLAGFTQKGADDYENDAWSTATTRFDIRASLGVGKFEVLGR